MKIIELLENAWKWHKEGNNDVAWHEVHAALIQLREQEAAQHKLHLTCATCGGNRYIPLGGSFADCPNCANGTRR